MMLISRWIVGVVAVCASGVQSAAIHYHDGNPTTPLPTITPAPLIARQVLAERQQQDPDLIDLANVLLTAVPISLRLIAATNLPAVSSILWSEFLDDNKPDWFTDLPFDVQTYLIKQFGPSTAWHTDAPSSSADFAATSTETGTIESVTSSPTRVTTRSSTAVASSRPTTPTSTPTSSLPAAELESPPVSKAGLSASQKVGLGTGLSIGGLAVAAIGLAWCLQLHRRRQRKVNGSVPPSSPGFIPRFAFQDRSAENFERCPLNSDSNFENHDPAYLDWDSNVMRSIESTHPPTGAAAAPYRPKIVPALHHTHSSNRARGNRTSYNSLHSVAEVSEVDETDSPVLGRRLSSQAFAPLRKPGAAGTGIKRKPVSGSAREISPAAQAASSTLLRQTMPNHSNRDSSGLFLHHSNSSGALGNYTEVTASGSLSSIEESPGSSNPFAHDYSYVEDYGPEFQHGYVETDNGLYGGNVCLSQYPEVEQTRKNSRTEWPLQNFFNIGSSQERSLMRDRTYDP